MFVIDAVCCHGLFTSAFQTKINFPHPAIKLANSGCEFPCTITTSDDGNDSIVLDFTRFTGRKLPKLKWWQATKDGMKKIIQMISTCMVEHAAEKRMRWKKRERKTLNADLN